MASDREALATRLKLHAYELVNGGANAGQLRDDLNAAAAALAAPPSAQEGWQQARRHAADYLEAKARFDEKWFNNPNSVGARFVRGTYERALTDLLTLLSPLPPPPAGAPNA